MQDISLGIYSVIEIFKMFLNSLNFLISFTISTVPIEIKIVFDLAQMISAK